MKRLTQQYSRTIVEFNSEYARDRWIKDEKAADKEHGITCDYVKRNLGMQCYRAERIFQSEHGDEELSPRKRYPLNQGESYRDETKPSTNWGYPEGWIPGYWDKVPGKND